MKKSPIALAVSMIASATLIAGCGQGASDSSEPAGSTLATLSVDLADAPVDSAANVFIRVKGITLHSPDGDDLKYQYCSDTQVAAAESLETVPGTDVQTESETPDAVMNEITSGACDQPEIREIDLLALTGGKSKRLLDNIAVPVGDYPWIRLDIDENQPGYIVLDDGTNHSLTIPGAANTGLKLVSGFSVESGGENQILIDFDLRKSVHKAGPNYRLKPALRLVKVKNAAKQRLQGDWTAELMGQCESPMAYIYEGADVIPDDIGGAGIQPLITAAFVADEDGTRSTYRVDHIDYGDYTVAFTCNGSSDSAESDDDLIFVQSTNVTVAE